MKWLSIAYSGSKTHKTSLPFKAGVATKQLKIALLLCEGKVIKSRKDNTEEDCRFKPAI